MPFVNEVSDAERALADTKNRLSHLAVTSRPKERWYLLQGRLDELRDRANAASAYSDDTRRTLRDDLRELVAQSQTLQQMVIAADQAGTPLLVCAANPWAPFGGMEELVEGRATPPDLSVEAFAGETESAALNLFNFTDIARTFRVEVADLTLGDQSVAARNTVHLHEVVAVPTEMRDYSADAIPELSDARIITVPAWDARQLWLNVETSALMPGEWSSAVHVRSLDPEPIEAAAPLSVTVWNAHLPKTQPIRSCQWGYVHSSMLRDYPQEALEDQVRHGTNVFVGLFPPKATYDEDGNLGPIDFAEHDAYVKAHGPHGLILFFNYQHALKGPGDRDSEAFHKAHVAWLRAWVKHLAELGVGYDGFALYPVDEPGLRDGLVETYLVFAQLAREADPKIHLYTDPVGRITAEELERMTPYVDIWCPNRNGLLLHENADKFAVIQNSGATVWTYECDGNAKHQSPLGYYRAQAWLAWHDGLTGIGFWSYCTSSADPWFRPEATKDYLLVYPGKGVISSKRWEAVRDGIEDYSMLWVLRQAVNDRPSADAKTRDAAQKLLETDASAVAQFCGLDSDDTQPRKDGLRGVRALADRRWSTIQETRRELAGLLSELIAN